MKSVTSDASRLSGREGTWCGKDLWCRGRISSGRGRISSGGGSYGRAVTNQCWTGSCVEEGQVCSAVKCYVVCAFKDKNMLCGYDKNGAAFWLMDRKQLLNA